MLWLFTLLFLKYDFRNAIRGLHVNSLIRDQNRRSVGPAIGPNCLLRLSVDDKCHRFQRMDLHVVSFFKVLDTLHIIRERSGSVVECLTRDRGAAGSSLTAVTALCSLSKTHSS